MLPYPITANWVAYQQHVVSMGWKSDRLDWVAVKVLVGCVLFWTLGRICFLVHSGCWQKLVSSYCDWPGVCFLAGWQLDVVLSFLRPPAFLGWWLLHLRGKDPGSSPPLSHVSNLSCLIFCHIAGLVFCLSLTFFFSFFFSCSLSLSFGLFSNPSVEGWLSIDHSEGAALLPLKPWPLLLFLKKLIYFQQDLCCFFSSCGEWGATL